MHTQLLKCGERCHATFHTTQEQRNPCACGDDSFPKIEVIGSHGFYRAAALHHGRKAEDPVHVYMRVKLRRRRGTVPESELLPATGG